MEREAECFGGPKVDHKFEFVARINGRSAGFAPLRIRPARIPRVDRNRSV